MKRGTVVRVSLDPVIGSEQAGTRPAVVISPTLINDHSSVLLIAPVTSKKMLTIYPFEAALNHERCGLSVPSKAMLNQLRVIDKARLVDCYGVVDEPTMIEIDRALKIAVGLTQL